MEFSRLQPLWHSRKQNRSHHVLWQELRRLENRWHSVSWQMANARCPKLYHSSSIGTGSVVEQINGHSFAKLHAALTHNGETTNCEALEQRVEQFNLSRLATTDTEVGSLKFHLTADAWEYPDWALFESFSLTTGDDLQLVEPAIRAQLEQVQRVEFAISSTNWRTLSIFVLAA